jgi:hypothetical protein
MTWLRLDTDAARTGVAGDLAKDLNLQPMHAFGHYVAAISGFGDHQADGVVASVSDDTLEDWALWRGKRGRFASAFRARCTADGQGKDPIGVVRGWWRQDALLRKQAKDNQRPPSHLRQFPPDSPGGITEIPPTFPHDSPGGDGGRRTEYGNEEIPTSLQGRLVARLIGHPSRYAVVSFLENLPPTQSVDGWAGCLLGCLDGLGLERNRKATVEDLAAACGDYQGTNPVKWGFPHFRGFVDRVVDKRHRPERRTSPRGERRTTTERAMDAAAEFAAKDDHE